MNAGTEGETSPSPSGNESRDDPSIFESQSKGRNLQEFMSERDPLNDDIRKGYIVDRVFKKILEKPGDHPGFEIRDDKPLEGDLGWLETVAFSPDGKCIVSGSADQTV